GQGAALIDALRELPALGLYREHQLQLQQVADTGRRVEQARCRLQNLLSDTLQQAAAAYAAKLPALAQGPEDWHGLYTAWIECAEAAYGDTVHGEPFCLALAEYVNASAAWREQCAAQLERTLKSLDLPTRSELNSLTARLKELETLLSARRTTPAAKPAP
ncbi:MAG: hypothetical protein M3O06_06950, partial [Pseudomonadota bacterium]|nr:hypothetical protein [Pseudomonadota bacterium]